MSDPSQSVTSCFVDTNSWLYALVTGSDEHKSARARFVLQRETLISLSTQVINEIAVNLLKTNRLDEAELRDLISSFYNRFRVMDLSQALLLQASGLRERYRFSYWDSLIVTCALASGATHLYSEDMQHGLLVDGNLRIVNPLRDGQ